MSAPIENINLCFVGGVSTGKSTLLNAIFCEELTQCKIKRTTMVPTIYVENQVNVPRENTAMIFDTISKKNTEIIAKTERGQIDPADYAEITYNVGPLDINIIPDSRVNVYDIPGLNDARTKDVYYTYLQKSFHQFNLVVFMVDIHSALNTSDEFDIVKFITSNTLKQKDTNGKYVYTLVVVNKADDMQLNDDTGNLEFAGEMREMFEQVEQTIITEFTRNNVRDNLIGIIPMCAVDAYLYRMVKRYGASFKLTKEQILKVGINENGKKFSTYSPAVQEDKVMHILTDSEFIDTMIALSGFGKFEITLREFLTRKDAKRTMPIENITYQLNKLHPIRSATTSKQLSEMVTAYFDIICKIKPISSEVYESHCLDCHLDIKYYIETMVDKYSEIATLISEYDYIFDKILFIQFPELYSKKIVYPSCLIEKVITLITSTLSSSVVNSSKLLQMIIQTIQINEFDNYIISDYIAELTKNPRGISAIDMSDDDTSIIKLFHLLMKYPYSVEVEILMRYLVICNINCSPFLLEKQLLYAKYGDHIISAYIANHLTLHGRYTFVDYLNPDIKESNHLIDIYYLEYTGKKSYSITM